MFKFIKRTSQISVIQLILLILFIWTSSGIAQINQLDEKNLEQTMRNPWTADRTNYIRDWLVLGGFPVTDIKEIDQDFLADYGGEKNVRPKEGESIQRADGTDITWQKYHSNEKIIDLKKVVKGGIEEDVIAYAYTIVKRDKASKVFLSLGSDDGIKIWLNGKEVHRNLVLRGVHFDEDVIEVNMNTGDNHLLFKVYQYKYPWGFAVRIIDNLDDIELFPKTVSFSISNINSDKNTLTVESSKYVEYDLPKQPINLQVYTTGRNVVFENTFPRNIPVTLNYKDWEDGVYEFKFSFNDLSGLLQTYYLSWYKGDILKAARELVNSALGSDEQSPESITHKMLADMILDRLENNLDNPDSSKLKLIHSPLMEFAELKAKKQIRPGGFVRLAYIDNIDGTPQFCRSYLPTNYNPQEKWPLVVFLHGYYRENPDYINWGGVDKRNDNVVDRYNFILIEPHGRGNTGYLGIGDRDVLKCIEMAKEKFSVNEDRIYLMGASMGGRGTWNVGSRHPEIFAALTPIFGGGDYHVWMNEDRLNKLGDKELYFLEKNNTTVQFEALNNIPILALHGDYDKIINVNNSRYLVRMLQRWGYDVRYREIPGKGHESLGTTDQTYPWILQQKRNDAPKKVLVRAADLRTASAYWVKITQRKNPWELMLVDAEILTNNIIRIDTKNILELILSPDEKLLNYNQPVIVVWNGEKLIFNNLYNEKIKLSDGKLKKFRNHKTPQVAGPISDFINTPHAIVIGTISQDSMMQKVIQQKADIIIANWKKWQRFEPRVFRDVELSKTDMKKYSLHLIGGPDENKVSKIIFKKIPVKIKNEKIIIDERTYQAEDAVMEAIYPNPFNKERYVRIVAATSGAGMYFYEPQRQDLQNYDYYIVDGKMPNSRAGFPEEKIRIVAGIFNNNWKIETAYLQEGDSELRAKCVVTIVNDDLTTLMKGAIKPPLDVLKSYVGTYKFKEQGFELKITVDNDQLMGQGMNGPPVELLAISENDFLFKEANGQLSFIKDDKTKESILLVYQGQQEFKGEKTK